MPPVNYPNAVLFDLDGTLLDTAPDLINALNRAFAEESIKPVALPQLRPLISRGAANMVKYGAGTELHNSRQQRIVDRMLAYYAERLAEETRLFDGMERVLDTLEDQGLSWGIVTNKRAGFTEPLVSALRLAERAACIISGDTTANAKPHPEPVLEACKRIGSDPQKCLFVGDSQADIEAGNRAGTKTLAALYGYIAQDDDPSTWGASGMLQSPLDLLQWLPGTRENTT